jgi:hypothetical protein
MKSINQNGNQVFSFERYLALLKTYMIENGKTIALYTAVFLGITILIESFLGIKVHVYEATGPIVNLYTYAVLTMGTALSSSLMFSSMQDKAGRIGTLMLPASHAEKFAVRTTVYLILYVITVAIVLLIGEGVRYICSPSNFNAIAILNLGDEFDSVTFFRFSWCLLIAGAISSHSTFTLGSILWPRKSFLKTYAACTIIQIVLSIILPLTLFRDYIEYILLNGSVETWIYASSFVYSAILYVIAFILFRRAQVVQRFM